MSNKVIFILNGVDVLKELEKQEKLLELYKEVNNNSKELISLAEHDSWSWRLYHEIQVIQDKIKELEK